MTDTPSGTTEVVLSPAEHADHHTARILRAAELLGEIIRDLEGLVSFADEDKTVKPAEIALMLFAISGAHEKLDASAKALYHVKDKLNKVVLPKRLEDNNTDIVRVPEIARSFSLQTKTSASFIDNEAGFAWLREIGQGDLITQTVNAGTLSAFVRNLQNDQGIDPPEEIVRVNTYNTISVNKYKPKNV